MPEELDGFEFAACAAMGADVQVQKQEVWKGRVFLYFVIEVAAPQKGAVGHQAAGATKVNQPGGFRREQPRHDCGSFPYFSAG
jgi:hypothetical protein